jgi:hypothetical protein
MKALQAILEDCVLISHERILDRYSVARLW